MTEVISETTESVIMKGMIFLNNTPEIKNWLLAVDLEMPKSDYDNSNINKLDDVLKIFSGASLFWALKEMKKRLLQDAAWTSGDVLMST